MRHEEVAGNKRIIYQEKVRGKTYRADSQNDRMRHEISTKGKRTVPVEGRSEAIGRTDLQGKGLKGKERLEQTDG